PTRLTATWCTLLRAERLASLAPVALARLALALPLLAPLVVRPGRGGGPLPAVVRLVGPGLPLGPQGARQPSPELPGVVLQQEGLGPLLAGLAVPALHALHDE